MDGLSLAGKNVASLFEVQALSRPEQPAVIRVRGRRLYPVDYRSLHALACRAAAGLKSVGLTSGQRVSLFVRPGPELIGLTYALLAIGAVPVLIDPGMGRRGLLQAIQRAEPTALIGVRRALLAQRLFPRAFESVGLSVCVDGPFPGARSLRSLCQAAGSEGAVQRLPIVQRDSEDPAAVLFTSGSTGPAKGVLATHGILWSQVDQLRALYGLGPGEIDLCCFPLFALFDTALGGTSVFPEINPSRPAKCRPADVLFAIRASVATLAFGSPAIWQRVLPGVEASGADLGPLRRVLVAGAPVPLELIERLRARLATGGEVHTPYGATECLPVSSISGSELLETGRAQQNRSGKGNCIGRPAPGVETRVIALHSGPLQQLEQAQTLPAGAIGELIVTGPTVTPLYLNDPAATEAAKLRDSEGRLWHRMGDLARQDACGDLWFLGRVSHRLETKAGLEGCIEFENLFLGDPAVSRVAVVGLGPPGTQEPHLILELTQRLPTRARQALLQRLFATARQRSPRANRIVAVHFHPAFPVDVRHNAKIDRTHLARWASVQGARGRWLPPTPANQAKPVANPHRPT
jgi:olefin beta-lactone synthetase